MPEYRSDSESSCTSHFTLCSSSNLGRHSLMTSAYAPARRMRLSVVGEPSDEQDPVGHRLFQAEAEAAARDDVGRADAGEKRDDERAERGLKAVHDRLTEVFRGEQLRKVHSGERLRDKSDMASHLVGRTDRHGEQPVDREQRDHQQNCTSDCLRSRSDPLFTFHMISSFIEQESVSCIITILWTKRACAARRERPSAGALRCRRSAGR